MPDLDSVSAATLSRLGANIWVKSPDPALLALAVGLARLYADEDRQIEAGKVEPADAFFLQPGYSPTFWPFFGNGRDREAMDGWWEYAQEHREAMQGQWWETLMARLLTGGKVARTAAKRARRRGGVMV